MDTLAHGLWGGALFGQKQKGQWKWAFWLGTAPDLFSFGPFFLTHLPMVIERWMHRTRMEPPDPRIIPTYVYHAYNVTHSLVIWVALVLILYLIFKKFYWAFCAWPLHILCDIPTHTVRFFPTPYLWPFPTPFVDGRPWSRPPFSSLNYILILLTYVSIYFYRKRREKQLNLP